MEFGKVDGLTSSQLVSITTRGNAGPSTSARQSACARIYHCTCKNTNKKATRTRGTSNEQVCIQAFDFRFRGVGEPAAFIYGRGQICLPVVSISRGCKMSYLMAAKHVYSSRRACLDAIHEPLSPRILCLQCSVWCVASARLIPSSRKELNIVYEKRGSQGTCHSLLAAECIFQPTGLGATRGRFGIMSQAASIPKQKGMETELG